MHKKARKLYGNSAVFKPIISDLEKLSKGIDICVNNKIIKIHFRMVLLLGYNLAMNSACQFSKGFNAKRYGRICQATANECQFMTIENEALLRNISNYEQDLLSVNPDTGIKNKCVWHDRFDYHVVEYLYFDEMHDICEGLITYSLSKVLTELIVVKKYFTIDQFNKRIKWFSFPIHETNKPRPILSEISTKKKKEKFATKIKFKQTAAESLCFARYLGIMVGDLIPDNNDEYWNIYKLMRGIISITTSASITIAELAELEILIEKLDEAFIREFGALKTKLHFLIHLP